MFIRMVTHVAYQDTPNLEGIGFSMYYSARIAGLVYMGVSWKEGTPLTNVSDRRIHLIWLDWYAWYGRISWRRWGGGGTLLYNTAMAAVENEHHSGRMALDGCASQAMGGFEFSKPYQEKWTPRLYVAYLVDGFGLQHLQVTCNLVVR